MNEDFICPICGKNDWLSDHHVWQHYRAAGRGENLATLVCFCGEDVPYTNSSAHLEGCEQAKLILALAAM